MALLLLTSFPPQASAQQQPAPIERRAPSPGSTQRYGIPAQPAYNGQAPSPYGRSAPYAPNPYAPNTAVIPGQNRPTPSNSPVRGEHLAQWMMQHSNLTPEQQQQALTREPGFRELPPQTQQRMLNTLQQLARMNPGQRQRLLADNEYMEHLSPVQRQQVTGAMQQLGSLPPEQRSRVSRTFRMLRDVPPEQRYAALASGRFGPPLDPYEQSTLLHLLQVEPLLPPPEPRYVGRP